MQPCCTISIGVAPQPITAIALLATVAIAFSVPRASAEVAGPAEQAVLRLCVSSAAMPRSGRASDDSAQGIDPAVAKLIADELNRPIELVWCKAEACRLQKLKLRQCDAVIGLPHESSRSPDIAWTKPYATGKFGLVVSGHDATIHSLADLRDQRIGIVAGSVALSREKVSVARFDSRESLLRGFHEAKLAGALIDADFAGWYLRDHPELKLRLVDEYDSKQRWSIGLAVRANDPTLRDQISRAVETCLENGKIAAIYAAHGLNHRAPPTEIKAAESKTAAESTWQRVRSGGKLIVSMDPANLPYSSADSHRSGFDVELARALGREMDVPIDIRWLDVHRETALGELLEGNCDLAFGAAIDAHAMDDEEPLVGKVIYSRPYYGTGYVLVARQNVPRVKSLRELRGARSRRIGTQAGTIADYSLRQQGFQRRLFGTQLATLNALSNGTVDYAYLWPNVAWVLDNSPEFKAELLPDYVPEERWNIAIAMRSADHELKDRVDRAIDNLERKGVIRDALRRFRMPYFAPFDRQKPVVDGEKGQTLRHQPVDRGLEPRMDRRQVSKRGYPGLERIRSRGTLIVGLDQNNLPFSSAHPQPSGLDYEIARRVAEKLGVAAKVYWAYSSHDSYPAKLAKKGLCDVIFGVMPDDRFADQVLFSEPYYHVEYQYAVRAASDNPDFNDSSIAVEAGTAVRGVRRDNMPQYASLEEVLDAVAMRRVSAGYVASNRGRWLAEQRWPGAIRFISPTSAVDRFAICAAVRRGELDLKSAIDEALSELRDSGELREIFARWNIPFDSSRAISKANAGE